MIKTIFLTSVTWLLLTLTANGQNVMSGVIPDEPETAFLAVVGLKNDLKKSEFETEVAYLERVAKLARETRVSTAAGRTLADSVFFLRDFATYDAEHSEFKFDTMKMYVESVVGTARKRKYTVGIVRRSNGYWTDDIGFEIPRVTMPADKARTVKPALTVAIWGTPVDEHWDSQVSRVEIVPSRLVVFDITTGEVFAEKKLP